MLNVLKFLILIFHATRCESDDSCFAIQTNVATGTCITVKESNSEQQNTIHIGQDTALYKRGPGEKKQNKN